MKCVVTKYGQGIGVFEFEENRLTHAGLYRTDDKVNVGDIFLGRVEKILPILNAYFVSIGNKENVFLPFTEAEGTLKCGDNILIQIKKEASKGKQPMGSMHLSLSGRYCVVNHEPFKIEVSSKLDKQTKETWKNTLYTLAESDVVTEQLLKSYCLIARTNITEAKDLSDIKNEWISLCEKLTFILEKGRYHTLFSKLHSENERYLQAIHKLSYEKTEEIITDDETIYQKIKERLGTESSAFQNIRLYQDSFPLEKVYSLNTKLSEALQKKVWLKSGGFLIIEPTEALTVIDVNSGKFEKKTNAEEYYKKVNMEAAVEIALQLKLRNLSGIIIIDFINMQLKDNQKELLSLLEQEVSKDNMKTHVIGMTALGLIEVTRKKVEKPLEEQVREISRS